MKDNDQLEQPQYSRQRRELTEEERREILAKRIKELRKRKRRQQRKANRNLRLGVTIFIAVFALLFILSSVYLLTSSGEESRYLCMELPASNLDAFDNLAVAPGEVSAPAISATAAILVDASTGDVLY